MKTRSAISVSALTLLGATLATPASAAEGQFTFWPEGGSPVTTINPVSGACYIMPGGAAKIENITNKLANVYADSLCTWGGWWLLPGSTWTQNAPGEKLYSIKFG